MKDGRLLAAFFNLGYDPLDEIDIVLDFVPQEIKYLTPDGTPKCVDYILNTYRRVRLHTELTPMYPLVLLLK